MPPRAGVSLVALVVPVTMALGLSAAPSAHSVSASDTTVVADQAESSVSTDVPVSLPPFEPQPIEWTPFGEELEEGWLDVPIDYANPDAGTFRLYLVRHAAADPSARIGSLLVNPGGPGFPGTGFAMAAGFVYGPDLLDSFDIIGWDPRGTGRSEPFIDCIDDYDEYYAVGDITPDDKAERQELVDGSEDFTERCVAKNEDFIQFVGTNNSARDIDTIRRALGEDEISYFGFSYGSELGGVWTTLFSDTVRAAVFDGAADPNADTTERLLQQVAGFEATLATFLAQCSANSDCAFHNDGDAEGAFDRLMLEIDEQPLPSVPGRPAVTRGVALRAVSHAMYLDDLWPVLEDALAAAARGDGSGLLALWDRYYRRQPDGTWVNSLEAFSVIRCMDSTSRPTIEEADAQVEQFNEVAPRYVPYTAGDYMCTFFPPSTDPRIAITGAGAGPIVVCGATGDPSTPLESTRAMAETLEDGRLIVIEADQHTCYGADECADTLIDDYLVELVVPPPVTEC